MSYSQRLLQQGTSITRLAHQSRFKQVIDALDNQSYQRVLDFGCGDGWLLKVAREQGIIQSGYGVDISDYMLSACEELFSGNQEFEFMKPDEMKNRILPQSCDLILCTETLEHVGNAEGAIADFLPYAKPGAKIIISVPIEVGPSLLVKQIGRYFANLKGRYGYERYRISELVSASLFWDAESFPSSHREDVELRAHKGFDYRKLEKIVKDKIAIERRYFSPFPLLGNLLNSTVVWVGRVKA
ncbi:class I SAM-dependent methyltransferase [Oscillatoria sp. FACHB-1406]|uniref:class I SAM-dependent methyltransferase n=1 Tax=Oscillatoria sp. FACHB-1406 TaxID=2692846 RepID=UPI0016867F0B|nr:class I SAM-dependent methyltransferase [Oscillatoria sp. FACHB-1406]MBD2576104.1 class I SAM-dependent methyltransferase [Oscillatoria sp. FACHB-1406]